MLSLPQLIRRDDHTHKKCQFNHFKNILHLLITNMPHRRAPASRRRASLPRRTSVARRSIVRGGASPAARRTSGARRSSGARRTSGARRAAAARRASRIRGGEGNQIRIVIKVSPRGYRVPYFDQDIRESVAPLDRGWRGKWTVMNARLARRFALEIPENYAGSVYLPEPREYDVVYEDFAGNRVPNPMA